MDPSTLSSLLLVLLVLSIPATAEAHLEDGASGLGMGMSMADSIYPSNSYHPFGGEEDMISDDDGIDGEDDGGEGDESSRSGRRGLLWRHRRRYYISYGALSANRIPCPPRSGRSYYSHNCYRASGPVRPYSRGCSVITRCRR
ncbi:protein RALF-like 34 [Iris pallida]|uniref:Protein RALF-like 34 n=2 Tax=Iris pallida TaxID=29817 RepID=A0AAX6II17_IRIPA|nr:protein RALF-like 34 [Iris pallida]